MAGIGVRDFPVNLSTACISNCRRKRSASQHDQPWRALYCHLANRAPVLLSCGNGAIKLGLVLEPHIASASHLHSVCSSTDLCHWAYQQVRTIHFWIDDVHYSCSRIIGAWRH